MKLVELGTEDLAKYPFLDETGEYIRSLDLSVEEITRAEYHEVLERAKSRVIDALKKGTIAGEFYNRETEILSFPMALVLIKATKIEHIISRYALAEAKRAETFLLKEKRPIISIMFERVLNIEPIKARDGFDRLHLEYKIPLVDFLKRAVHFHTTSWRLVNRVVEEGFVLVTTTELVRLLREEIYEMIQNKLKSSSVIKLNRRLRDTIDEIIRAAPPIPAKRGMFSGDYPPCVTKALELLETGQNVPHYGRFLMTTFLLHAGKNVDNVIELYPRVPDFKERVTRYQVEHIAGLRGGRTAYSVPGCNTILSNNFCFRNHDCGTIRNPLQFRRKTRKKS